MARASIGIDSNILEEDQPRRRCGVLQLPERLDIRVADVDNHRLDAQGDFAGVEEERQFS